jgi:hypothetical protein
VPIGDICAARTFLFDHLVGAAEQGRRFKLITNSRKARTRLAELAAPANVVLSNVPKSIYLDVTQPRRGLLHVGHFILPAAASWQGCRDFSP